MKYYITQAGANFQAGGKAINELGPPSIRGTLAGAASTAGPRIGGSEGTSTVGAKQDSTPGPRKVPGFKNKAPSYQSMRQEEPGAVLPFTHRGDTLGRGRNTLTVVNPEFAKERHSWDPSPWTALNKAPGGMAGGGTMHTAADTGTTMFKRGVQNFTGGRPQTWSAERKKGLPGRMGTNLALGSKGSKHPSQTRSGDFLPDYEDLKSSKSGKGYMLGRMGLGDVEGGIADLSLGGAGEKGLRTDVPWYPGRAASKKTLQRDKGEQAEWDTKYKDWREHAKDPEEERRMGVMRQNMRRVMDAAKKSKIEREGPGIKFDR